MLPLCYCARFVRKRLAEEAISILIAPFGVAVGVGIVAVVVVVLLLVVVVFVGCCCCCRRRYCCAVVCCWSCCCCWQAIRPIAMETKTWPHSTNYWARRGIWLWIWGPIQNRMSMDVSMLPTAKINPTLKRCSNRKSILNPIYQTRLSTGHCTQLNNV